MRTSTTSSTTRTTGLVHASGSSINLVNAMPLLVPSNADEPERLAAAAHPRELRFDVAETRSLEEALRVLERLPVDIVLCDVTLPGQVGGRDLMRWLSEHRPAIKRIVTADSEATVVAA